MLSGKRDSLFRPFRLAPPKLAAEAKHESGVDERQRGSVHGRTVHSRGQRIQNEASLACQRFKTPEKRDTRRYCHVSPLLSPSLGHAGAVQVEISWARLMPPENGWWNGQGSDHKGLKTGLPHAFCWHSPPGQTRPCGRHRLASSLHGRVSGNREGRIWQGLRQAPFESPP